MTKKLSPVIVSFVLFALLLSGCKMPASEAPEEPAGETRTTPIRIQTDSPELLTQTAIAESANTATLIVTEEPQGEVEQEPTSMPTNTPQPTAAVAVPTVTRPAQYTLQEGEFPYCIARRYNLNPEDLLAVNNLGPNELVSPGTTLQIPQSGSWVGEGRVRNPHPTTHTVEAGETIYSIACYYGDVSPEAIIAVNNLEEPYDLTPGQSLNIP